MAQQHTSTAASGQKTGTSKQSWALGGHIVRTPQHARRILRMAVLNKQEYLIPQARSVLRQLEGGAA